MEDRKSPTNIIELPNHLAYLFKSGYREKGEKIVESILKKIDVLHIHLIEMTILKDGKILIYCYHDSSKMWVRRFIFSSSLVLQLNTDYKGEYIEQYSWFPGEIKRRQFVPLLVPIYYIIQS